MAVQALLTPQPGPAGYLHRELLIRTPEGRRVDLLTVTDCHGVLVGAGWSSCLPFAIRETAAPGASAKGVVDKAPGEGGEGEGVALPFCGDERPFGTCVALIAFRLLSVSASAFWACANATTGQSDASLFARLFCFPPSRR